MFTRRCSSSFILPTITKKPTQSTITMCWWNNIQQQGNRRGTDSISVAKRALTTANNKDNNTTNNSGLVLVRLYNFLFLFYRFTKLLQTITQKKTLQQQQ